MRLATLRDGSRDGRLIVVNRAGTRFVGADSVAGSLQAALDRWPEAAPGLRALAADLEGEDGGAAPTHPRAERRDLDVNQLAAPLPRAYEWIDGSAYLNHIRLVRRARGAELPDGFETDPLVYQGGSGVLRGPRDPLPLPDLGWGLDFEAEVAVILGDVPERSGLEGARAAVRLLLLANDVTLRNLVPAELAKGFGFVVSKPPTAFSPFAVTPDELGGAFRDGRVHLRLRCTLNGTQVGDVDTGPEMHFSFYDLIAHVTRTRPLTAGSLVGSGTVSNEDQARGVSCLVEQRTRETLAGGGPRTPYLAPGDTVRIEAFDAQGRSVFGAIEQTVQR